MSRPWYVKPTPCDVLPSQHTILRTTAIKTSFQRDLSLAMGFTSLPHIRRFTIDAQNYSDTKISRPGLAIDLEQH